MFITSVTRAVEVVTYDVFKTAPKGGWIRDLRILVIQTNVASDIDDRGIKRNMTALNFHLLWISVK